MRISREERRAAGAARHRWLRLELDGNDGAELRIDERFLDPGPVFAGPLIDAEATRRRFGGATGRRPEDWITGPSAAEGAIAFCPTNFGWQHGAWLSRQGTLLGLPDEGAPAHPTSWLVHDTSRGWRSVGAAGDGAAEPAAVRGPDVYRSCDDAFPEQVAPGSLSHRGDDARAKAVVRRNLSYPEIDLRDTALGLEMPALVRAGSALGLETLVAHPRLLADARNLVDFSTDDRPGFELSAGYWLAVRCLLPRNPATLQALLRGETCEWWVDDLPREALVQAAALLTESGFDGLHAEMVGMAARVFVRTVLRATRLPLMGFGLRRSGELVVLASEGRTPEAPGLTVAELGELLVEEGAETGWLGSAGGDVAVVRRTVTGVEGLGGSASHRNRPAKLFTREVPSLLVVTPARPAYRQGT